MLNFIVSQLPMIFAEVHDPGAGFWDEVWGITFDPAHIIAEIIFTIVLDGLFVALVYNIVFKKMILPKLRRDIHKDIDEAHGEDHSSVHTIEDKNE